MQICTANNTNIHSLPLGDKASYILHLSLHFHPFIMSWQAYVDSNLLGTQKVKQAAIHGHDGSLWATSSGFSVSAQEAKDISEAFTDPTNIRANGVFVNGVKYFALACTDRNINAKKGSTGVVAEKTEKAILIAVYDENIQPGEANKVVGGLGDYLRSVGY